MKRYRNCINAEKLPLREYWYLKDLLRKHSQEICPESKHTGIVKGVPYEKSLNGLLRKFDL